MMTPKLKAIQLVNEMYKSVDLMHKYPMCRDTAVQCALKCVYEAQELLNKPMFQYKESMLWKAEFEYWDEVKEEINKL